MGHGSRRSTCAGPGQSDKAPVTWVRVRPPTHTWPSLSLSTCTRPTTPEPGALRGHVGVVDHAGLEQPLADGGVQAAGDRVLQNRTVLVAEEGADLDLSIVACCMGTDDTHVHPGGPAPGRFQSQDRLCRRKTDPQPSRPIVDPPGVHDVLLIDTEEVPSLGQFLVSGPAGPDQRGSGEGPNITDPS